MGYCLLSKNIDLLRIIGDDIERMNSDLKYNLVFPCLTKSVQQSSKTEEEKSIALATNAITILNFCKQFRFR